MSAKVVGKETLQACRSLLKFAAFAVLWWRVSQVQAEDHLDYQWQYYGEENHRIRVNTQSALFAAQLNSAVAAHGELVYDSVSGASPTGAKMPPTPVQYGFHEMHDIRRAASLGFDFGLASHTLSPEFSYSKESDYESRGLALTDAIEFNQKNTMLTFGVSQDFDNTEAKTSPLFPRTEHPHKNSTQVLIGLSQLLSPNTVLAGSFTYGSESGFLGDPYKGILSEADFSLRSENRPAHRTREIVFISLKQFVEPLKAGVETSYRFFHDSNEIFSHTVSVAWRQHLGRHFLIEPNLRFYEQSAASFYMVSLPAGFSGNFYSADYRLSHFYSFDYGVQATAIVTKWFHLSAGYRRYEIHGLDATAPIMYPKANVLTLGASLWF